MTIPPRHRQSIEDRSVETNIAILHQIESRRKEIDFLLSDPDWVAWLEKGDKYGWSSFIDYSDWTILRHHGFVQIKNNDS